MRAVSRRPSSAYTSFCTSASACFKVDAPSRAGRRFLSTSLLLGQQWANFGLSTLPGERADAVVSRLPRQSATGRSRERTRRETPLERPTGRFKLVALAPSNDRSENTARNDRAPLRRLKALTGDATTASSSTFDVSHLCPSCARLSRLLLCRARSSLPTSLPRAVLERLRDYDSAA